MTTPALTIDDASTVENNDPLIQLGEGMTEIEAEISDAMETTSTVYMETVDNDSIATCYNSVVAAEDFNSQ